MLNQNLVDFEYYIQIVTRSQVPKLTPSWANSLKLRNFWDSGHALSFQH